MKTLIYLHGFNSSPESHKAQLAKRYFSQTCPHIELEIPKLSPEPFLAIEGVSKLISERGVDNILGFVGSSLGGYYSLHLMQKYYASNPRLKAVLINPALKPYELLTDYLGENTNYYSGDTYTVLPEHMDELKSLDWKVSKDTEFVEPCKVFVLTQTKDEVLDYQQALDCLPNAKVWVQSGGDHSFVKFENVLPAVRGFILQC